jgi:glycolate oxidase FAD binding subunit
MMMLSLDGLDLPHLRPGSVDHLGEVIREAKAKDAALYPLGGLTHLALGNPPSKQGTAIDLRGLTQIIDFPARDMTVTVQTGITMQALRETLTKANLRLPIDVAQAERATLGGVLAANVSGPRRCGYGTLRDYVIGISAFNDDGREFKAGGRVVKNVAGYDLCKLLVGSLGTLGIITQATLKLRPLVEAQAIICLGCEANQLESLLSCLHGSRTRPICLDVLNQPAAQIVFPQANLTVPEATWTVLVGYEGNANAVSWQVQQLVKEVCTQRRLQALVDFTALPLCNAVVEFGAWPTEQLTLKASVLPSAVAAFCQGVDHGMNRPALCAHAGNGIVQGRWRAGLTMEQAASMLTLWRDLAPKGHGTVIVPSCPSEWKRVLNIWGPPSHDAWLMREVKAKFDPKGIFNPGRFVDGI